MKTIRVFPRPTNYTPNDEMAFIGDPPLSIFRPEAKEVHVSCVYTWDIAECKRLVESWKRFYPVVKLGGPAIDTCNNSGQSIPGMYVKNGIVFTSRGCIRKCPWCMVRQREGNLKEMEIYPGNIIQDNNLLACSDGHIKKVFRMLKKQSRVEFAGGLDFRCLKKWHVKAFKDLKVYELWFANDTLDTKTLESKAELLVDIPIRKKRCFVLLGFFKDDTPEKAESRLQKIFKAGFLPYPQYYRGPDDKYAYPQEWHKLVRRWARPYLVFLREKKGEI